MLAGHGDFAAGLASAVAQISGRDDVFALVTNRGKSAEDIERALRDALDALGANVVFTDLPAGSCTFAARRLQRERVTNYLDWLVRRNSEASFEARAHVRIVPFRRIVALTVGGEITTARIVDVSRSGVALTTTRAVAVGDDGDVQNPVPLDTAVSQAKHARVNEPAWK